MWPSPSPSGRGNSQAVVDAASLGQPIRRQRVKPPAGHSVRSPQWQGVSTAERDGLPTVGAPLPRCAPSSSSKGTAEVAQLPVRVAALPGVDSPNMSASLPPQQHVNALSSSVSSGLLLPGGLGIGGTSQIYPSGETLGPPPRGPSLPLLRSMKEDDSGKCLPRAEPRRLPPLCRGFNSYEVEAESPCSMTSNESEASTVASESEEWEEKEMLARDLMNHPPGSALSDLIIGDRVPAVAAPTVNELGYGLGLARIEQAEAECLHSPGRPGLPSPPVPPPPVVPPLDFVPAAAFEQSCHDARLRAGSADAVDGCHGVGSMSARFEPPIRREWRLEGSSVVERRRGSSRCHSRSSRCHSRERPISRGVAMAVGNRGRTISEHPIPSSRSSSARLNIGPRPRSSSLVMLPAPEAWSPTLHTPSCMTPPRAPPVPSPAPVPCGSPEGPCRRPSSATRTSCGEGVHGAWVQLL